ncbi:MAG: hypothetical protein CL831_07925 [Crocinitomicaceae bacterium]|nr:hypothetical protein [Crocinitomicaceae bacterium]
MVGDTALSEWIQLLSQALEDQQSVIEAMQGAGGCDFKYPEGLNGDAIVWDLTNENDYAVPEGKNLIITHVFSEHSGQRFQINDKKILSFLAYGIDSYPWDFGAALHLPLYAKSGDVVSYKVSINESFGFGSFCGMLTDQIVEPITFDFDTDNPENGSYSVPMGKQLIITNAFKGAQGTFVEINGVIIHADYYNYNEMSQPLEIPLILKNESILSIGNISDGDNYEFSFNGYLVDKDYFADCGGGGSSATSDSPVSSVSSTPSASPPYVWGTNYIQQVNPSDPYLVGSYKQIRSALFIWSGDEGISYGVPNNTANPLSGQLSLSPPCQGGGELLKLGTPKIWDLPSVNYYAPYHTFSIPALASRTMMTVELSIDIWYDSTGQDRVNTVLFWLGKNGGAQPAVEGGGTGPMAFRMATHMPSYFGTNNMEPTFCHTASITLLGSEGNPVGPAALLNDFDSGDIFYITAQAVGSPSFPRYKNLRVKVTWEAVN